MRIGDCETTVEALIVEFKQINTLAGNQLLVVKRSIILITSTPSSAGDGF